VRWADEEATVRMTTVPIVSAVLALIPLGTILSACHAMQTAPASAGPLTRHYREGERLSYRMTASNRDRARTTVYEATARGVVKRDNEGRFFEEYQWFDIIWNGAAFDLPPETREFRQLLSLSPDYTPSLPDFSRLHPRLIGPTADLLTFYSDVWLAMRQPSLRQAGDRARVSYGQATSWADGTRVLIGEDAIDFDIVLGDISLASGTRDLTVRHIPPERPNIRIPAEWMRAPVAGVPNNWVQVVRARDGRYVASVGKETFDATIRLSLSNGRIVSARLENAVEVLERECTDEGLTKCGPGVRYQILRQIEIAEIP
jgi:hypothetical protein